MMNAGFTHRSGTIDLRERPRLFGVLNVTPDSFFDGGQFATVAQAVARAHSLIAEGADVIDVGGESTRPGATEVDEAIEALRVVPVVAEIARLGVPVSVDTRKAFVAERALSAGASIVNDVSGLNFDARMARVVAKAHAGLVVMHMRGTPATMQSATRYDSLWDDVIAALAESRERALVAGVARESIAVDPGIGFAKTPDQSLALLGELSRLHVLGCPVLVGPSRKSFIGAVTGKPPAERLYGTAAAVAIAIAQGVAFVRTHDVAAMRDVVSVAHAIRRAGPQN